MKHIKQFLVMFIALFPAISFLNVQTNNADEINNIDSANVDETISEDNATNIDVSASEQNSDEQPSKDTRVANEFNVDVTPEQLKSMPTDKYKFKSASKFNLAACVNLKDLEDGSWLDKAVWAFADNHESITIDFVNADCPEDTEPTTIIHCTIAPENITVDLLKTYYTFESPEIDYGGVYHIAGSNGAHFQLHAFPNDRIIVDSEYSYKVTTTDVTMTQSEALEFFKDFSNTAVARDKIAYLSGLECYWYNHDVNAILSVMSDERGYRQGIPGQYTFYATRPRDFPIITVNIIDDPQSEDTPINSTSSTTRQDTAAETISTTQSETVVTQTETNKDSKTVDTATNNTVLLLVSTIIIVLIMFYIIRYGF